MKADSTYLRIELTFYLPDYLAACEMEAIGLASGGTIPDSSFSASSHFNHGYIPSNGRLNGTSRGWAPKTNFDSSDYLQIDLPYEYVICAVATQGANGINKWTTTYKIRLSMDGTTMVTYKENNVDKVSLHKRPMNVLLHIKISIIVSQTTCTSPLGYSLEMIYWVTYWFCVSFVIETRFFNSH